MIDYNSIFEKYLVKLEYCKGYRLGAIYARLIANGEIGIDISFLFLFIKIDKRFICEMSNTIDNIIIRKIE